MYDAATGHTFNCCEQYMMFHKALTFSDTSTASAVLRESNPCQQKALGKAVKGFTDEVWDRVKFEVVVNANVMKFTQCTANENDTFIYPPNGRAASDEEDVVTLKELLLAIGGRELAEASRFDRVWGIGFGPEVAAKTPKNKWGQNCLGKALMEVRKRLREQQGEKTD